MPVRPYAPNTPLRKSFPGRQTFMTPTGDITRLLLEASAGGRESLDSLYPLVYDELRRLAAAYLRRESGAQTLQATALVNEAYLKLVNSDGLGWKDRAHFFAVAAKAMRYVLLDHARRRHADKRGGVMRRLALDETELVAVESDETLIALDEALTRLAGSDARAARIIELRYFGGLTDEEAAAVEGVSEATVKRELKFARAWLFDVLGG